jgi:PAS domain S-box-containing protein
MARPSEPGSSADAALRAMITISGDGLGLVDARGRFASVNPAGAGILGQPAADLVGRQSPFPDAAPDGPVRTDGMLAAWARPDGRRRTLEYRRAPLPGGAHAVWFSDVTDTLRQQERLTAIVRAASRVAASGSLRATLDAVAREVAMTAHISAAQILTLDDPNEEIRVLGMAGFGDVSEFTDRLSTCRRLGAHLRFMDAFESGRPIVVPHRRAAILADPRWAPLHEIMSYPDWDSFVAMPLIVRGQTVGVINAYYIPGEDPGPSSLVFLEAMADHAAVAIDTAALLARTRSRAVTEERRRLARDLHDSVVQQLFSMRMQVGALSAALDKGQQETARLRTTTQELAQLAHSALADLRGLVFELRPLDLAERGLAGALRAYAESVEARTGLLIDVTASPTVDTIGDLDVQEDLYRIVQEAVHNVVKHADAHEVAVRFTESVHERRLVVEISDDGCAAGEHAAPAPPRDAGARTMGLVSMRERAQQWGGQLSAGPRATGGWSVVVNLPLPPIRTPAEVRP